MDEHEVPCKNCDGDGYIEVSDPNHDNGPKALKGAVIGAIACPSCEGLGVVVMTGKAGMLSEQPAATLARTHEKEG